MLHVVVHAMAVTDPSLAGTGIACGLRPRNSNYQFHVVNEQDTYIRSSRVVKTKFCMSACVEQSCMHGKSVEQSGRSTTTIEGNYGNLPLLPTTSSRNPPSALKYVGFGHAI